MENDQPADDQAREARVVALRDAGASWSELQQLFGLSRQQVRYRYQRGKRAERRRARRQGNEGAANHN